MSFPRFLGFESIDSNDFSHCERKTRQITKKNRKFQLPSWPHSKPLACIPRVLCCKPSVTLLCDFKSYQINWILDFEFISRVFLTGACTFHEDKYNKLNQCVSRQIDSCEEQEWAAAGEDLSPLMARSHCTGTRTRNGTLEQCGFTLHQDLKRDHCLLLCQSHSLYLSRSHVQCERTIFLFFFSFFTFSMISVRRNLFHSYYHSVSGKRKFKFELKALARSTKTNRHRFPRELNK